jgi:PKD repeat protein
MKRSKTLLLIATVLIGQAIVGCAKSPSACFKLQHDNPFKVGEEIQFDGSCSTHARYYSWYFKDGAFISPTGDPKASHTFTAPGTYAVKLSAEGKNSNESNVEMDVTVN